MLLNPEGNRDETRKGIKFWIERLIINSAEELGLRGTQLQKVIFKNLKSCLGDGMQRRPQEQTFWSTTESDQKGQVR